ncbi:AP-3 complex subunit mu-2 [Lemmus lemmus]
MVRYLKLYLFSHPNPPNPLCILTVHASSTRHVSSPQCPFRSGCHLCLGFFFFFPYLFIYFFETGSYYVSSCYVMTPGWSQTWEPPSIDITELKIGPTQRFVDGKGVPLPSAGPTMIHSLFLINSSGDIFLEKHWKSVVSRSVCDYFFEAQERATEAENVPPVIPTPHHYLLSVYRHKIFFVAVIQTEVPPLFVIEFLHRVVDTFQDYFGVCSEPVIKDNVVVVYEVLEEMLDNGFPLATESNILKELIKPPTILRTVVNTITGSTNVGDQLPTGQLSVVPWRRTGVKYTNNEAYFDVVEEIDAIIDKSGSTVTAEIQGVIDACVKLTGMPDLTLSFMNPRLLDDVSFHPCVRFKRWESERILSFIPPDGNFRLLSYHVSALVAIPVYVKHSISFRDSSSLGRFEITVGPKQSMGKTIEGVTVTSQMPKGVLNMSLTPSQGTHTFDPVTKVRNWAFESPSTQAVYLVGRQD